MSGPEAVLNGRRDGVAVITINRPEARNAVNAAVASGIAAALDELDSDPDLLVGIITGAGGYFCAGMDLKAFASGDTPWSADRGFAGIVERSSTKPLIAAVEGFALAGGLEIALACDLIVASEAAVFALPEPRVGLAALAGGLHRLPRVIGSKRALGMILTGRRVSAREGLELGFVNDVVVPAELMNAARGWAKQILELSPMSIRASKEAVYKGLDEPSLADAIAHQGRYPAVAAMFKSTDFVEGPRAFAEKRPPRWKGE
jgi:enoyl-CoA hydratase/carnithine racemase